MPAVISLSWSKSFQLRVNGLGPFSSTVLPLWKYLYMHSQLELPSHKNAQYILYNLYQNTQRHYHHEQTYFETQATSAAVLKIIWSVLLLWTVSPLTRQWMFRLSGSAGEVIQNTSVDIKSDNFYTMTHQEIQRMCIHQKLNYVN